MTRYEYKLLDKGEQYNVLWNNGVFIARRISASYNFLLYQIEAFYMEVKYNREENRMVGMKSFITTELLKPYHRKINLDDKF
jgi:hypothetical protein